MRRSSHASAENAESKSIYSTLVHVHTATPVHHCTPGHLSNTAKKKEKNKIDRKNKKEKGDYVNMCLTPLPPEKRICVDTHVAHVCKAVVHNLNNCMCCNTPKTRTKNTQAKPGYFSRPVHTGQSTCNSFKTSIVRVFRYTGCFIQQSKAQPAEKHPTTQWTHTTHAGDAPATIAQM